MSTKVKLGIAAIVLMLLCGLLTVSVIMPKQIQGDVLRLRLLTLKQSDSGLQATFELRNENGPKVDVWSSAELTVLDPVDEHYDVSLTSVTIDKGDKADITIDVPKEGKWQWDFASPNTVNERVRSPLATGLTRNRTLNSKGEPHEIRCILCEQPGWPLQPSSRGNRASSEC